MISNDIEKHYFVFFVVMHIKHQMLAIVHF